MKQLIGYVMWNESSRKPVASGTGRGTPRIYKHEQRAIHEAFQFDSPDITVKQVFVEVSE